MLILIITYTVKVTIHSGLSRMVFLFQDIVLEFQKHFTGFHFVLYLKLCPLLVHFGQLLSMVGQEEVCNQANVYYKVYVD